MFGGDAVGFEDHASCGQEGVGTVGEIRGAGMTVGTGDGDGVPTVGLDLRRMSVV